MKDNQMAAAKNKESLYRKNVRGTFYTGYDIATRSRYLFFVVVGLHTALLPLTLTLGAGIKTLVDWATRSKPLSNEMIAEGSQAINNSDAKQLGEMVRVIKSAKLSSISSKRIFETIYELKRQEEFQRNLHLSNMKQRFANQKAASIAQDQPNVKVTYQLTVAEEKAIEQQEVNNLAAISKSNTALMRDSIKRYFASPDNNGKELHSALQKKLSAFDLENGGDQKATPIYTDADFEERVIAQITRLKDNGKWWKLGIGNNAKAQRIESALVAFNQEKTAENMHALKLALDERRLGASTGFDFTFFAWGNYHTNAYTAIFGDLVRLRPRDW